MNMSTSRMLIFISRGLSTSSLAAARGRLPNSFKTLSVGNRKLVENIRNEQKLISKQKEKYQHRDIEPLDHIREDPARVRRYCAEIRNSVGSAIVASEELRAGLAGKGLSITKVHPTYTMETVRVYWVISKADSEAETSQFLLDNEEMLRLAMVRACPELGKLPRLIFVKDLEYLSRLPLESEFNRLKQQKQLQVLSDDEAAAEEEKLMDEICAMKPPTDSLGFNRAAAMKQVLDAVIKSKASHRVTNIPGPDSGQEFKDYMKTNYESRSKDRVKDIKRYIAKKKSAVLRQQQILAEQRQPEAEQEH